MSSKHVHRKDDTKTESDFADICVEKHVEFDRFLRNETVSALLGGHIAVALLCIITFLNYVKSGLAVVILPYIPCMGLFIVVRIWHEISPPTLIAASRYCLEFACFSVVLGATAVAAMFVQYGVESLNAPVLISLIAAGGFSLYKEHQLNYARNFAIMVVAFLAMYCLDAGHALRIAAQYPLGFFLGSLASFYLLRSRKAQFCGLVHARSGEAHALNQLKKMLLPHQMARISVGDKLEDTMPEGFGNAYIICLDVAGSSHIHHDRFHEMLHRTFHDCYSIMMENYTQVPLQANGYPVKWLGDGFLCSVGFPLAVPGDQAPADIAESLGERFCETLCSNMLEMRYSRPIACGIGIAKGTIEGFYPANGPKLYDLKGSASGDPIMLSTRYEHLRKLILPTLDKDASIVVLQESVFLSLSPERQKLYTAWAMTGPGTNVRDDPGAKQAYYRLLPHVPAYSG